jgi:WD40 repeat protein
VRCVAFNRAATLLASGGNDAAVHLWRIQAPPAKPPSTAVASVRQAVESVRESLSFLEPPEATMRLRSLARTSRGAVDWGHAAPVLSCQFSFDDRVLATASADRTTCLWRCDAALTALTPLGAPLVVPKHALLRKLVGHKNSVTDVSFSPDSLLVLTASLDETVRLWRVDDGLVVKTLVGHTDGVCSVSFHADGTLAVSSGMDNTLRVWDVSPYARAPLAVASGAKRGSKSLVRYRPTGPAPAQLERTLRAGSTQRVAVVGGVRNPPPPGTAATRRCAAAVAPKIDGAASKVSAAASKESLSK